MIAVAIACVLPAAVHADATPVVDLASLQSAFEQVLADASPGVVGVRVYRRCPPVRADLGIAQQYVLVNGTGTVLRSDGLILTNEHVVQSAFDIEVTMYDGTRLAAAVLAADPRSDLAVLKVPRGGLQPIEIADWAQVRRGQWAIAVGNPLGLGSDGQASVSVGVISNLGRRLPGLGEDDDRLYSDMIQTTAAINPGNSGGPLFDINGHLVGVVTAVYTRAGADEGVGFAIPMTPFRRSVVERLLAGELVEYGYLGLAAELGTRDVLGHAPAGLAIVHVEPGGPACAAGLQVDDRIITYDGHQILDTEQLVDLVGQTLAGQSIEIGYERAGYSAAATVVVERRDLTRVAWMRGPALLWRGARLVEQCDVQPGTSGVIVLEVAATSPAGLTELTPGDVIEEVNRQPVDDLATFETLVRGQRSDIVLTVRDRGQITVNP
ncbi:MAG: trypsin-like peptidase domain-containing protein [Phycisphaerae bacterium]|nr:trypsin-like peptidase domain-containing protein [Phycisphaerae bacterium]